jgi:hypothetical protein
MKFLEGQIIIRSDMTYPAGALVVSGVDESGNLRAYPEGGGPEFIVPQSDISHFSVVSPLEAVAIYRRTQLRSTAVTGASRDGATAPCGTVGLVRCSIFKPHKKS